MPRTIYMSVITCFLVFSSWHVPRWIQQQSAHRTKIALFYGCDVTGSRTRTRTCTVTASGGSTECLASQQCEVEAGMDEGFVSRSTTPIRMPPVTPRPAEPPANLMGWAYTKAKTSHLW